MNQQLENARREFLDECDIVVRSPAVCFLYGSHDSLSARSLAVPIYIYFGLKEKNRKKELQLLFCNGASHWKDFTPNNMEFLDENSPLYSILYKRFFEFNIDKGIKKKEKEQILGDMWAIFNRLSKIAYNIGNVKLKIWSEVPIGWPYWDSTLDLAYTALLYCWRKHISPKKFSFQKDSYIQKIQRKCSIMDEDKIGSPTNKPTHCLIEDMFMTAWLLSSSYSGSNGAVSYTSLLGNIRADETNDNFSGFSFKIIPPTQFDGMNNLSEVWFAVRDINTLTYRSYILKAYQNGFHVTIPNQVSRGVNVLSIYWRDNEDGLSGPVFSPLFFNGLPPFFNIIWPIHEIKSHNDEKKYVDEIKAISYRDGLLQIVAHADLLQRIKKEIYGNNYLSKIYYDSECMGWHTQATVRLKSEEYKINKPRTIYSKSIQVPKDNIIEISIYQGEAKIKIGDEDLEPQENEFARFLLCAVARIKGRDFVTFDDFYLSGGRQALTPLKKLFKRFKISFKSRTRRVYFNIPQEIHLDKHSLCQFESEHYEWTQKAVAAFFTNMNNVYGDSVSKRSEKAERILFERGVLVSGVVRGMSKTYAITTKLTSVVRNTDLVMCAVSEMGWQFHNEKYCKEWSIFKSRINEMLSLAGYECLEIYFSRE